MGEHQKRHEHQMQVQTHNPSVPTNESPAPLPAMRKGPSAIPLDDKHGVWVWDGNAQNLLWKPRDSDFEIDYIRSEVRPPPGWSFVVMNVQVVNPTQAIVSHK